MRHRPSRACAASPPLRASTASSAVRRGGQVVRRRSRKPKIAGSNPVRAWFLRLGSIVGASVFPCVSPLSSAMWHIFTFHIVFRRLPVPPFPVHPHSSAPRSPTQAEPGHQGSRAPAMSLFAGRPASPLPEPPFTQPHWAGRGWPGILVLPVVTLRPALGIGVAGGG